MKSHCLIIFSFVIFSCTKERADQQIEKPQYCDSIAFTFEKDILPVFTSNCNFSACHAAGGTAGYDFTQYSIVASRVRAGTVDYRIDLPFEDPQHMPEKMHLSECDYFIIKTWIRQGFPEK